MATNDLHRRLVAAVERGLGRLAIGTYRRPLATAGVALVLTALSLWAASMLHIDPDISALLPEDFASVRSVDDIQRDFGGVGYVSVIVRGQSEQAVIDAARRVADDLEKLERVRFVEVEKPVSFFADRALYYLSVDDLREVSKRIARRVKWEQKQANPLFVPLVDEPKPRLDFSDIEARYRDRPEAGRLDLDRASGAFTTSKDGKSLLLLVKPTELSSDLDFSRAVVADVEEVLSSASATMPRIRFDVTGRYKKKIDQQAQIVDDMTLTSAVALALILLFLVVYFRGLSVVGFVMTPLVVALALTFGAATWLFGTLNILTAFVGTILVGLGIDHGIHLFSRFRHEAAQHSISTAVSRSFAKTGRAVLIAGITTLVAFLALAVSDFVAFRQFGVMVAFGMAAMVLTYTLLMPALIGLAARVGWRPSSPWRWHGVRPSRSRLSRWSPAIFWVFVTLVALSTASLGDARFNQDFGALENKNLPSSWLDVEVNEILGRSQTPLAIRVESEFDEARVAEVLRDRVRQHGAESTLTGVLALGDLVPEQQETKADILSHLQTTLRKVKRSRLGEEDRSRFDRLDRMAAAQPFGREDLPGSVSRNFVGLHSGSSYVLAFPAVSLSDGPSVRRLAEEVSNIELPNGSTVSAAGEAMILADVLETVISEAPWVMALAVLGVFAVMVLLMNSFWRALLALSPALVTVVGLGGLLGLTGLEINYLNMVILPALIGIGVDGGVHLVIGFETSSDTDRVWRETGGAILGAMLTTGLGFGVLALAEHPGLQSLGHLALLGVTVNLLACLAGVAGVVAMMRRAAEVYPSGTITDRLSEMGSTMAFAGLTPKGSGTVGAAMALPAGAALLSLPHVFGALVLFVLTVFSVLVVDHYQHRHGVSDASEIVLDEFVGCLIAMALVPATPLFLFAAFVMFRVFDIAKPWPISVIDRRLETGLGVIGDDVVAGLAAGVVVAVVAMVLDPSVLT